MVWGTPQLRRPGHSARHMDWSLHRPVGRRIQKGFTVPLGAPSPACPVGRHSAQLWAVLTASQKSGGRVTPGPCCPETPINHTPMPQPPGATRVPSVPLWGKSWGVAEVTPLPFLLEGVGSRSPVRSEPGASPAGGHDQPGAQHTSEWEQVLVTPATLYVLALCLNPWPGLGM